MTKTALPFFSLHCNWLFYIIKLNKDQFNDNTSNIGIVGWCFLNIYFQQIMLFFWKYYFVGYLTWVAASITAKKFFSLSGTKTKQISSLKIYVYLLEKCSFLCICTWLCVLVFVQLHETETAWLWGEGDRGWSLDW